MLQEVQGVTPSAAAGIRTEFSSFKVLMDAYEKAERKGRERAELMLQDCEVGLYSFCEVKLMVDQESEEWDG
jgi:crossover junction endonuclease EME1